MANSRQPRPWIFRRRRQNRLENDGAEAKLSLGAAIACQRAMQTTQWQALVPFLLIMACGGSSDGHHAVGHGPDGGSADPIADSAWPIDGWTDAVREDGAGAKGEAAATPTAAIGDACTDASTCPAASSGTTTCLGGGYPDGYCAIADCATHGHDCPGDATISKCVLAPTAMCLRLCATDADCRQGYSCVDAPDAAGHGASAVCIPK